MITVKVDYRGFDKKMRTFETKLDAKGKETVAGSAKFLREGIKRFMPKKTKESADSIIVTRQINSKGKHEAVVGEYPLAHPEKIWRGQHFDLPAWMMTSTRALKHPWKNGNINMISTRRRFNIYKLTEQKFNKDVRNAVADSVRQSK